MRKKEKNDENAIFTSEKANIGLSSDKDAKSISGRIRKIGNSRGILLTTSMIKDLGVADDAEVTVTAEKGRIIITPRENKRKINTDLSSWEAQFKAAIKNGDQPEIDMFEGMENEFDKEEW